MKTGKNFIFNFLQTVSQVLFPLITFPYASRILGPEGIGAVNFAESFCRYFMLFAALGVPIYGIREIAKVHDSPQLRSKVFSEIFSIHFVATVLCLLVYTVMIFSLDKFYQQLDIYLLGVLYIFINVFSVEWFFSGLSEFKYIAIRSVVIRLALIAVLFVLVKTREDVFWYFGLNVFALVANNLINVFYMRNKVEFQLKGLQLKKHFRPLFYIFLSTVAISVYVLIDTLILGFLKGDLAVGYYTVASKLNKVTLSFIAGLGIVLIPQLTKAAHNNDIDTFKQLIAKSTDFVIMFSIPIAIGLYVCAPQLVFLFSGEEFVSATFTMQLMTSVTLLIGLSNIYGLQILTPFGKDKFLLIAVSIGTVLSLLLNFILIPIWAENGAALANVFSELIVTIATGYFAAKTIELKFPLKSIVVQFICYFPIFALMYLLTGSNLSPVVYMLLISCCMLILFLIINIFIVKNRLALDSLSIIKTKLGYERV